MTTCKEDLHGTEEHWSNWKTIAGYAYILICITDFLIMPIATHTNQIDTKEEILAIVEEQGLDTALKIMDRIKGQHSWIPVTMTGGGLFHISFGAILTGAAITRGIERKEIVKNGKTKRVQNND